MWFTLCGVRTISNRGVTYKKVTLRHATIFLVFTCIEKYIKSKLKSLATQRNVMNAEVCNYKYIN